MKNHNLLVFTLLVVIGFCSCEKETAENGTAKIKITQLETKSGDDDDDPIVQGVVLDNGVIVEDVVIAIIPDSSEIPTDVTNANRFSFQVSSGDYFLKITREDYAPVTTEVFNVSSDIDITVNLD